MSKTEDLYKAQLAQSFAKFQKFTQEKSALKIEQVTEQLAAISREDRKTISEALFREGFLPLFLGEPNSIGATLDHWIAGAGGYYHEVDVLDYRESVPKYLFTVPPIYANEALKSLQKRDASKMTIADIVAMGNRYAMIHPNQGSAYLQNGLSSKFMQMHQPGQALKAAKMWNIIFAYYDKPLFVLPGEEHAGASPIEGAASAPEYDGFDEL